MRGEASTACGFIGNPTAVLAEETRQEAEKEPEEKFPDVADAELTGKLADEAIGKVCENRDASPMPEELAPLIVIANDFFVRNSLIYDAKYDMESIKKLADRCVRLKTAKNPAEVVLKTILRQFKIRATTKGDYFYGCKITPQYLLTENTWHHMLQQCSALLLTNRKEEAEWQFQMSAKNPEDQRAIYDDMENQCIKYGIDPNDPRRAGKLMIAMQTASEAVKDTG